MANAFDGSRLDTVAPSARDLIRRRGELLGPAYRLFYETPVEFVRGEGVHLYDPEGNAWLDAYNNVPSVGHSHPHVVAAVAGQEAILNTHTRYPAAPILDYAERLLATHSPALERAMFTCTGSEAVDLALRIARFSTGGHGIVATANAYHGVTTACAGISPSLGVNSPLDPSTRTVEVPGFDGTHPERAIGEFTAAVSRAIDEIEAGGAGFAAFIADSVFSSDGIRTGPPGLLAAVADLVRARGGIYIADEVQSGFARTGERMWGYQRHGFEPDIAVMGKPMGNGMPIAAVAARAELLEEFGRRIRYFNTFGGNSVCVAAASAVLDVIEREGLAENSRLTGAEFKQALTGLAEHFDCLGSVRGVGLFLAVDIVNPETGGPDPGLTDRIVNGMMARRVLISSTGPRATTLKIRPPLPFNRDDLDQFISALKDTCHELSG